MDDVFGDETGYGLEEGLMKRYCSRTVSTYPDREGERRYDAAEWFQARAEEAADAVSTMMEDMVASLDGARIHGLEVEAGEEGLDWLCYEAEVLYDREDEASHETEVVACTYTKEDEVFLEEGFEAEVAAFNEEVEDAVEGRDVVDIAFVTVSSGGDPGDIGVDMLGRSFQALIVYEEGGADG